jgi:GMP synthase-like glutamine amidotransferase
MKVVFYEKNLSKWLCYQQSNSFPILDLPNLPYNLYLSAGILASTLLNLLHSPLIPSLHSDPNVHKLLDNIAYFAFSSEDTLYIPMQNLANTVFTPPASLLPVIEDRFALLSRHSFSRFAGFSEHSDPDYLLFHLMDQDPWYGTSSVLYASSFVMGTEKWSHYFLSQGHFPSERVLASAKGIVITGSESCAYEEGLAWKDTLCDIIRSFVQHGRIVGICFGQQILAVALGGVAGKNPSNEYVYKVETVRNRKGTEMKIMQTHGDCVLALPPGAEKLLTSDSCDCEAFYIPDKVLAVQGHPEYSESFAKLYDPTLTLQFPSLDSAFFLRALNVFLRTGSNLII